MGASGQETLQLMHQNCQPPEGFCHSEASVLAVGDADHSFRLHLGGEVTLLPSLTGKKGATTPHTPRHQAHSQRCGETHLRQFM